MLSGHHTLVRSTDCADSTLLCSHHVRHSWHLRIQGCIQRGLNKSRFIVARSRPESLCDGCCEFLAELPRCAGGRFYMWRGALASFPVTTHWSGCLRLVRRSTRPLHSSGFYEHVSVKNGIESFCEGQKACAATARSLPCTRKPRRLLSARRCREVNLPSP